mgnify:FL=1
MTDPTRCTVTESGWSRGASDPVAFADHGRDLVVELKRWSAGETFETTGGEEVGAVLEGAFELVLSAETHRLEAGTAVVIPPGEPHRWRLLAPTGVLYRVVNRTSGAPAP